MSSRAVITNGRTRARCRDVGAVARRRARGRWRRRGSRARPRRPHRTRRVLADPAGEDQRVQAVHGGGHRGDAARAAGAGSTSRASRRGRVAGRGGGHAPRACPPVPARPARPERCSSPAASSAGGQPRRSVSSQSSRPGSTLPDLVAITRPSSGVKPIVVSTLRPPWTARQRRPRAEVTGDDPARRPGVAPEQFRGPAGGVGVRQPVEPVPAQRRALPPGGGQGVGGRRGRQAWRGRRCRSRPPRARRAARAARPSIAASAAAGAAAPGRSGRAIAGAAPRRRSHRAR